MTPVGLNHHVAVRSGCKAGTEADYQRGIRNERAEIALPSVVKKDGTRAEFDASKIQASMQLALRKRPVSVEKIDAAMERIQEKLLNSGAKEVPSTRLGELVMRELKRIDKVAYVRFASVYRSFEDVDEFRQLIRDI